MDILVKNKEGRPTALDVKQRVWSMPVEGAPAFYRSRTWPYKGRRTRVKVYPTFPQSYVEQIAFHPLPPALCVPPSPPS